MKLLQREVRALLGGGCGRRSVLIRALAVCGRRGLSFAFLTFVVAFAARTALRLSDSVPSCKVGLYSVMTSLLRRAGALVTSGPERAWSGGR